MKVTVKTLARGMLTLALGAVVACAPDKPAMPTYTKDVGPISRRTATGATARKVRVARFKGSRTPPRGTRCLSLAIWTFMRATLRFAVRMVEALLPPAWARTAAGGSSAYIQVDDQNRMPPAPASKLDDWEIDVVVRWAMNPSP